MIGTAQADGMAAYFVVGGSFLQTRLPLLASHRGGDTRRMLCITEGRQRLRLLLHARVETCEHHRARLASENSLHVGTGREHGVDHVTAHSREQGADNEE